MSSRREFITLLGGGAAAWPDLLRLAVVLIHDCEHLDSPSAAECRGAQIVQAS
jgi:hypothetical protein